MVAQPNLRYLRNIGRKFASSVPTIHNNAHHEMIRKIKLRAMYKFFPPAFVDEVKRQRRSDASEEALINDFFVNEQPEVNLNRDFHYKRALNKMIQMFKPKELLKPVAFPDLRYYPWNLAVSAEAPYTFSEAVNLYLRDQHLRGYINNEIPTFHNLFNLIFFEGRNIIHMIKDRHPAFFQDDGTPKPAYWSNLHARAHVVGEFDPDKIRAVFGVTRWELLAANMFIWPMQAELLNRDPKDSPMMWGCEIMRGGWKRLRKLITRKMGASNFNILSADWSQFDRRALHSIIQDTYDTWHTFYDWTGLYQPTSFYPNAKTDPKRLQNVWDWFTYSGLHTPILLPNGDLYEWTRNGIASGYMETQLLDSWVNGIMLLTCLSEIGVNIDADRFFCKLQGDDSVITFGENYFTLYGEKKFLTICSEIAKKRFNAKLSVDKSHMHNTLDGVYVLGYYNTQGLAWRTDLDLMSHFLFPERPQLFSETAGSCAGLALASMGCSKQAYDVFKDAYDFITLIFGYKPRLSHAQARDLEYMGLRTGDLDAYFNSDMPIFPTFEQSYFQNFILEGRTEQDRQRTWPTDPFTKGGFMFL